MPCLAALALIPRLVGVIVLTVLKAEYGDPCLAVEVALPVLVGVVMLTIMQE